MNVTILAAIISSFCGTKDMSIPHETKVECYELMVNCAVVKAGSTTPELIEKCKHTYGVKK